MAPDIIFNCKKTPRIYHIHVYLIIQGIGENDLIIPALRRLADILRSKKAYTNTATFDLKCEVSVGPYSGSIPLIVLQQCGKGLKGEKEASVHAEQTGHVRFGEY